MIKSSSRFAALLAATALFLGVAATIGVFELTGSLGTTKVVHSTTTVVTPTGSATISSKTDSAGLGAQQIYTSTAPGVVDITSKVTTISSAGPFDQPQSSESTASGSGFVVDTRGHIVTAAHVVEDASSITVKFQDGTTRKATLLGKDDATDIAVIKVDPSGLKLHPLTLGSASSLSIGDSVAAVGDPFGYERSFSTGIVSGLDRTIEAPNGFTVAHAIQSDTALNPGNSGGPMLDSSGKVIGIVDQIATDGSSQQSSGVGFAVPIDLVKSELATLQAGKQIQHAYIGVSTSEAGGATRGALLQSVTSGGPAASAGLKAGDVVTKMDGQDINGSSDLVAVIAAHKPGDRIGVSVYRAGSTRQMTVTLGTQPATRTTSQSG